jgi:hypothetical protein
VRAETVESDSLSAANPRDYRWGTLLGWTMVLVGALLAVILVVIEMGDRPTVRGVWVIEAMIEPALLILTGILVTGRAKLGLWLKYLLTADFVYSLILQFVRALRTKGLDDIYRVLFDACVRSIWLCIVAYLYSRREMFTGFWGSIETDKIQSVDARNHAL